MLLDPDVILYLTLKDLSRFSRVSVKIILLGDDADAYDVVGKRDIPKPAFFRDIGDRRGPLVNSWIAQRALVIGPYGDLVEIRIAHLPAIARDRESVATCRVHGH